MLIICQIDWREVGVAFELQCLRNCTLSSYSLYLVMSSSVNWTQAAHEVQLATRLSFTRKQTIGEQDS